MAVNNPLAGKLKGKIPRSLADFSTGAKGPNDPRAYRSAMRAGAPTMAGDGLAVDPSGALEFAPNQESLLKAAKAAGPAEKPSAAVELAEAGKIPHALDRNATALTISNNAAEATLYSFILPAGTLVNDRRLRLRLLCQMLNNTGVAHSPILRVKLGGTTLYDDDMNFGIGGIPSIATGRGVSTEFELAALSSANSQMLWGEAWVTNAGGPTTGWGAIDGTLRIAQFTSAGPTTVNMDLPQLLEVTIQLGAASANLTWTRRHALLEVY